MPSVYLLHFIRPISDKHTTQHYLGWTPGKLENRIATHLKGRGSRLCEVARERGIGFTVARIWEGDRTLERQLKRWKCSPRLCPHCKHRYYKQQSQPGQSNGQVSSL